MDRLFNAMKLHASGVTMAGAEMRFAIVTSYDPNKCAARVQIQPDGVLTGWLPVSNLGVGAVAIIVPPSIGDQVIVAPQEGDGQQWVVIGRVFSNAKPPPASPVTSAPVQSGEAAIIGAGGSCLHFKADGSVWLHGNLNVQGNIGATGTVTAGVGGSDQVGLQTHTHPANNTAPTAGT